MVRPYLSLRTDHHDTEKRCLSLGGRIQCNAYLAAFDFIPALYEMLANIKHHGTAYRHMDLQHGIRSVNLYIPRNVLTSCQGILGVSRMETALLT